MPDVVVVRCEFVSQRPNNDRWGSATLRSQEGIKGAGLLQEKGERCSYQLAGNLDTTQGTYSVWVWNPGGTPSPQRSNRLADAFRITP